MNKHKASLLFLSIAVLYFIVASWHTTILQPPHSIHKWRQTDNLSFALNYYKGGMNFFCPENHILNSDDFTTGFACPGELPLTYYVTAIIYHITGPKDYIMRILHTLIFFGGMWYFHKTCRLLLKDIFWSVALPFLVFVSPLLFFYGSNYVIDTVSLSFVFAGIYYLVVHTLTKTKKSIVVSLILLTMAALFKITSLVILGAAIFLWLSDKLISYRRQGKENLISYKAFPWVVLVSFTIIVAWVLFAMHYNKQHQAEYYTTYTITIWSLSAESIKNIWYSFINNWGKVFLSPWLIVLMVCQLLILVMKQKKYNYTLKTLTFFSAILPLSVFMLFYYKILHHDYYFITSWVFLAMLSLTVMHGIKENSEKLFKSVPIKIVLVLLIILNANYSQKVFAHKYYKNPANYEQKEMYQINSWLKDNGVSPDDRIIYLPGYNPFALYFMDRQGWTQYTTDWFFDDNFDSVIPYLMERGADYLMVYDFENIIQMEDIQPYTKHCAGIFRNKVFLFKLPAEKENFSIIPPALHDSVFIDFETTDSSDIFDNKTTTFRLKRPVTLNNEKSYSGNKAIGLGTEHLYDLNIRINNVNPGDVFHINAMRLSEDNKGTIVLQADSLQKFYHSHIDLEDEANAWVQVEKKVVIPENFQDSTLSMYLYYSGKKRAWFDDVSVKHFKGYSYRLE